MSSQKSQQFRRSPLPTSNIQTGQESTSPDSPEHGGDSETVNGYAMRTITIKLPLAKLRNPNDCPPPRNVTIVRVPTAIGTLIQAVAEGMGESGVASPIGLSAAGAVRHILEQIAQELRI